MTTQIDFHNLPDGALLRPRQVVPLIGLSASSLWRYVRAGKFPKPIKVDDYITAWKWADVRQWLDDQAKRAAP